MYESVEEMLAGMDHELEMIKVRLHNLDKAGMHDSAGYKKLEADADSIQRDMTCIRHNIDSVDER